MSGNGALVVLGLLLITFLFISFSFQASSSTVTLITTRPFTTSLSPPVSAPTLAIHAPATLPRIPLSSPFHMVNTPAPMASLPVGVTPLATPMMPSLLIPPANPTRAYPLFHTRKNLCDGCSGPFLPLPQPSPFLPSLLKPPPFLPSLPCPPPPFPNSNVRMLVVIICGMVGVLLVVVIALIYYSRGRERPSKPHKSKMVIVASNPSPPQQLTVYNPACNHTAHIWVRA